MNELLSRLTPRVSFALIALACAGLLGTAYILQYVFGQDPCPLCLVQRGFFYGVLVVSAVAAWHAPKGKWLAAYGIGALLFAAGGAAVAGRHVWLQHLPPDKVPSCGPDLYFMLENFPLARLWEKLLYATGQCAQVSWRFLGLSIAEWSLVWFVLFILATLWLSVRALLRR